MIPKCEGEDRIEKESIRRILIKRGPGHRRGTVGVREGRKEEGVETGEYQSGINPIHAGRDVS